MRETEEMSQGPGGWLLETRTHLVGVRADVRAQLVVQRLHMRQNNAQVVSIADTPVCECLACALVFGCELPQGVNHVLFFREHRLEQRVVRNGALHRAEDVHRWEDWLDGR